MKRVLLAIALVILLAGLFKPGGLLPAVQAQSTGPTADDLIAAVNQLRTSKDLEPLLEDAALTTIAQAQAEYLAANNLVSHVGPGGSRPRDRAISAGYGGGAVIYISENVAMTQLATTLDTLINTIWTEPQHWNTMTNSDYVHAGAGIAESGGSRFYTLVVGYIAGGATSYTPLPTVGPGTPQPTIPSGPAAAPVITATALADGSLFHIVQSGQVLSTIAEAYGMPWEQLAALNNLDMVDPVIFEGQSLLVRPQFTPTVTPTITLTPRPPTRTPRPTFTLRPTQPSPTPTQSLTPTRAPLVQPIQFTRRNIGLGLIVLSSLGLAATGASYAIRRRKK